MELNDRIHYDAAELVQQIEASLDCMKPYQYDSKYRDLLGSVVVDKLSVWERNIRKRKSDPFTIVVCGDFKRGKSSVINALLGEDISPTNVTTETVTLNRILYGTHSNEALLSGGRRMSLTDEELCRDALEDIMKQSGETITQLSMKRPIDILKDITIIDTPGLSDSERDFSEEVEQALRQADAVIYVFSVSYPLSRSEQLYLKTSVIPQKYTSLFLVANFCDTLIHMDNFESMKNLLNERVSDLLPGNHVYMISALDERCRQLEVECPNKDLQQVLEEGFDAFRDDIQSLIDNKREMVLPDRMQRMTRMMVADVNADLSALEQGLEMTTENIQSALHTLSQEKENQAKIQEEQAERIRSCVRNMQIEAMDWMGEVLNKMKEDTLTLNTFSTDDIVKYYSLFSVDTLQEAMNRCVERHTENLMDELDKIASELTKSFSKNSEKAEFSFRMTIMNRTWTKGDNVSFVGSRIGMGVLGLVANGIGGLMRKNELQDRKPEVIKSIKSQYENMYVSIQKEITKTYQKLAERAILMLQEYYTDKINALEQKVEQSAMVARQDDEKKAEIRIAINEIREVMEKIQF
ncbi:MAG: dynamin family protein [Oliverpabstia sp.]